MSDRTAIEWTEATWNPVTGCSKVSPGCANCYAEALSLRFGRSQLPWTRANSGENLKLHPERLAQPSKWRDARLVFVNSMSDLFHEDVPVDFVDRTIAVMECAAQHTYQVLTKRPERALRLLMSGKIRLSLLKIPSEPEFERLRESVSHWSIAIDASGCLLLKTSSGGDPSLRPRT